MSVKERDLTQNNVVMKNNITYIRTALSSTKSPEGFTFKEQDYYKLCKETDPWTEKKIEEKVSELELVLNNLEACNNDRGLWLVNLGCSIKKALNQLKNREK